jgi:hypothetical protein
MGVEETFELGHLDVLSLSSETEATWQAWILKQSTYYSGTMYNTSIEARASFVLFVTFFKLLSSNERGILCSININSYY